MQTARHVNDSKPEWVIGKVVKAAQGKKTVLCLGVTYKADIDDVRESPALDIAKTLTQTLDNVLVCDPHVTSQAGLTMVSLEEGLKRADVIVILVDHSPFKAIDWASLKGKTIIDCKGLSSCVS